MAFNTYREAKNSLREFSPAYRAAHTIVRFYSTTHACYRYTRVFGKAVR